MTILPPSPGEPRRTEGPRDPGDAWVVSENGERYWGRFGAAGLLAIDSSRGVLLQHRVSWSHFGGTWGLPGGALHQDEEALDGALREATEEAGIPEGAVSPIFSSTLDLGIWAYTTVGAEVVAPFEPVISDPESLALEWVQVDEVAQRPLHPGLADSWPRLRALLGDRLTVVVDAANVVGSVPDWWWKDRAGATGRLRDRLIAWQAQGLSAEVLGLGGTRWYPAVTLVAEGAARAVKDAGRIQIRRAPGHGDDEIVAAAEQLRRSGGTVLVVTSDAGLRARVETVGARAVSAGWLLSQLPA